MKHKHRPCPCGCGDLADECMSPHAWRNPLGAFQIDAAPELDAETRTRRDAPAWFLPLPEDTGDRP